MNEGLVRQSFLLLKVQHVNKHIRSIETNPGWFLFSRKSQAFVVQFVLGAPNAKPLARVLPHYSGKG